MSREENNRKGKEEEKGSIEKMLLEENRKEKE